MKIVSIPNPAQLARNSDIVAEGESARDKSLTVKDCPYPADSEDREYWLAGFRLGANGRIGFQD